MTIPTQKEWVEGCLAYYKENDYQPGNPEDGVWEEAHYPAPKCLGGSETILLLKEHHAVQGVLQSEEFQHPCFLGWEKKFLDGELLSLFEKWHKFKCSLGWKNLTKEQKEERINKQVKRMHEGLASLGPKRIAEIRRRTWDKMTEEQKTERLELLRKGLEKLSPEERSVNSKKGWANLTDEKREERIKKSKEAQSPENLRRASVKRWEGRSEEEKSAIALKGWETRRKKKEGRETAPPTA